MALSKKQQAFVEYYLQCWNATKAATLAGYSAKTARQQGSRLLSNVDIQVAIDARIKELQLDADEVLIRLGQQARGEQAEYIGLHERHDPDTGARWTEPEFDFERCQVEGKLHLIKGWSYDRTGRRRSGRRVLFSGGSVEGLTEGRIVHYVLLPEEAERVSIRHRNHIDGVEGNPASAGEHLPAIVVAVWDQGGAQGGGCSNLQVILDGNDSLWVTSRMFNAEGTPGTWHWIEPA